MPDREHTSHSRDNAARHGEASGPESQDLKAQPAFVALGAQLALQDPALARPADLLVLQRTAGNQAVSHLIQARLAVGPAHDRYEQEADQIAEQVLARPAPPRPERQPLQRQSDEPGGQIQTKPLSSAALGTSVRRQSDEPGGEIQAKPDPQGGFDAGPGLETRLSALKGHGSPLPGDLRASIEPRFGADLSGVRLHTDPEAAVLNRQIEAQAFTHGQDIYMGAGGYEPGTAAGKRLLAHELTHVVQQTGGGGGGAVQRWPGKAAPISAAPLSIRRSLVKEAARAFGTVGAARQHVDPIAGDTDRVYTYGELATATNTRMPASEQRELINVRPLVQTRKKSPPHEKALKDAVRAHILGQYAKRLSELPAKYPDVSTQKAKKKVYLDKARFDRSRGQGLVTKGRAADETKTWLAYTGLADVVPAAAVDSAEARNAAGVRPRIDVRATSYGNKHYHLQFAYHVFIIYTDTTGQEYLIRGGPGEAQPGVANGYVTGSVVRYHPQHPDWDPGAQSVTVMQGPEAAGRLDAMVAAALSLEQAQVPYSAGERMGEIAENCNTAAWTILKRAGVPTQAPGHGQAGWGHMLGAKTPGKAGALPQPETNDGPGKPRRIGAPGAAVFQDRQGIEKKTDLAAGLDVTWLERSHYDYGDTDMLKIKYQGNQIGFVRPADLDLVPVPGPWVWLDKSAFLTDPETDELTDDKLKAGTAVQIVEPGWNPEEPTYGLVLIRYRAGNRLHEAKVYSYRLPESGWGQARKAPKKVAEGARPRQGFFASRGGPVATLRRCPHCHAFIDSSLNVCPHCNQQQYCANCHTELSPNMNFCPMCATPAPWAPPPPVEAEAEASGEPEAEAEAEAGGEFEAETEASGEPEAEAGGELEAETEANVEAAGEEPGHAKFCPECGERLNPGAKFCGACGANVVELLAPPEGEQAAVEGEQAGVEGEQAALEGEQAAVEGEEAGEPEPQINSPFIDDSELETRENMGTGGRQTLPQIKYGLGVSFEGMRPRLEFGKTFTGFFKTERPEERQSVGQLIEHYGINPNNPEVTRRNLAAFRLSQWLGADVIPPTFLAKHQGQIGFVSEKVEGTHGDETAKPELQNPLVRQALSKLYMLDAIGGQIDRHGHNWIVEKREGQIVGVKGIDNDYGFGEAYTGETMKDEESMGPNAFMRGIRGKLGRELTEIDEPFARRIVALAHNVAGELTKFLAAFEDLLSEGEIKAMHSRLLALAGFLEPLLSKATGIIKTDWNR